MALSSSARQQDTEIVQPASKQTSKTSGRLDAPRLVLSDLADALFEAVPYGLVVTDQEGVIQWGDRSFGELVTKDPDQLQGLRLARCVAGTGRVLRNLKGHKKVDGILRLRRRGTSEMQLHVQAVRGGLRASDRIVWVFEDNASASTWPRESESDALPVVRASRPGRDSLSSDEGHFEALRLLHELAATE